MNLKHIKNGYSFDLKFVWSYSYWNLFAKCFLKKLPLLSKGLYSHHIFFFVLKSPTYILKASHNKNHQPKKLAELLSLKYTKYFVYFNMVPAMLLLYVVYKGQRKKKKFFLVILFFTLCLLKCMSIWASV